ncbi:MAG TPA: hypothetical protein VFM70_12565, partial [Salinimicrobium sp.]|nr:hypothetical protein [Salinimicrobium sp.]
EWVHLVLGAKDPTIKAADTFKFLSDHLPNSEMFAIHLKGELKHRIPLKLFTQEVDFFFREYW